MRDVIYISAKCSDMCSIYGSKDGRRFSHDDYPWDVAGLMGGDYVDFGIDLNTGQIVNWETVVKPALMKQLHSDEVAWEEL